MNLNFKTLSQNNISSNFNLELKWEPTIIFYKGINMSNKKRHISRLEAATTFLETPIKILHHCVHLRLLALPYLPAL
jgi:hypothetical protein